MTHPAKLVFCAGLAITFVYTTSVHVAAAARGVKAGEGDCTLSFTARDIARGVLAHSASRMCKNYRYSVEDVNAYLEKLKCHPESRREIEKFEKIAQNPFDRMFVGGHAEKSCREAANFLTPEQMLTPEQKLTEPDYKRDHQEYKARQARRRHQP